MNKFWIYSAQNLYDNNMYKEYKMGYKDRTDNTASNGKAMYYYYNLLVVINHCKKTILSEFQ